METVQGFYDVWRIVIAILAVAAGSLIGGKARYVWWSLDSQAKFLYGAAAAFCAVYVWSALEALYLDAPGGPRTVVSTIPLVWLIIAGLLPAAPRRLAALRRFKEAEEAAKAKRQGA